MLPEVYRALEDEAKLQNSKGYSDSYDVWRGVDMSNFVENYANRLVALNAQKENKEYEVI